MRDSRALPYRKTFVKHALHFHDRDKSRFGQIFVNAKFGGTPKAKAVYPNSVSEGFFLASLAFDRHTWCGSLNLDAFVFLPNHVQVHSKRPGWRVKFLFTALA